MKIAIISFTLAQGGSQRFVYEHAVEFKKKGHECFVITKKSKDGFYVGQLEKAGVRVLGELGRRIVFSRVRWLKLTRLLHSFFSLLDFLMVQPWKYDLVLVSQIESYSLLSAYRPWVRNAIVILMSHKFQYPRDPYSGIKEKMRVYLMDDKQKRELVESGVDFEYVQYPLSLRVSDFPAVEYAEGSNRIGYFARLSPERPVEFIFFALHLLKNKSPDVVLHIFGRGELSFEQRRILKILGVERDVIFEGHAQSIPDAIREKNISAVWLTCYGNTLGFGAIEMMAHRAPLILWNLDPSVRPSSFLADHDLERFVEKTVQVLADPVFASHYIRNHYLYVSDNCDVAENSSKLIEFSMRSRPEVIR